MHKLREKLGALWLYLKERTRCRWWHPWERSLWAFTISDTGRIFRHVKYFCPLCKKTIIYPEYNTTWTQM